jgi:protein disulfide-isomerase
MRVTSLAGRLLALCAIPIIATPSTGEGATAVLAEEAVTAERPAGDDDAAAYTVFNGVKVPPMIDIEGDKFAETVKEGYWYADPPFRRCCSLTD